MNTKNQFAFAIALVASLEVTQGNAGDLPGKVVMVSAVQNIQNLPARDNVIKTKAH